MTKKPDVVLTKTKASPVCHSRGASRDVCKSMQRCCARPSLRRVLQAEHLRQHTSEYVRICPHTSEYVRASAAFSRQNTYIYTCFTSTKAQKYKCCFNTNTV